MNILKKLALGVAITAAFGSASAANFSDGGASLQGVIDSLYVAAGTPTGDAPNVVTDQHAPDEVWNIGASGASVNTFIIQLAGLAGQHEFGIYDVNDATKKVTLFSGAQTQGTQIFLSVNSSYLFKSFTDIPTLVDQETFSSANFGYYLTAGANTFYSQSALNGGDDHMVAYEGDGDVIQIPNRSAGSWSANEYILGFEDLPGASGDFDDFVVLVESVNSVPEPGTLALVGLTLAGMGALSRRRKA